MPTYEYYCISCGFEFEEFQSIASEPIQICPQCNGQVKRKISGGSGLIFKGSGFYITDYKQNKASTNKTPPSTKPESKEKTKSKAS
jgi:putative FmdB family regulatory protein